MGKNNIRIKKNKNQILKHIYGQGIALIVLIVIIFFWETKSPQKILMLYTLVLAGMIFYLFFYIHHLLLLLETYENSSLLYQDSLEVLENINIYIVDLNLYYLYMNKSDISFMEKYFGCTPKVGDNVSKYLPKLHYDLLKVKINNALSKGVQTSSDKLNYKGKDIYLYTFYSPVYNTKGQAYAVCCITMNVTESVNEKKKFKELIYQDPLTSAYNRRKIYDHYNKKIRKTNTKVWIIVFDLDNFKKSNDNYGHSVGDQILKDFTKVLHSELPSTSIISRIGGDEFCAIVEDTIYEDIVGILSSIKMGMHHEFFYGVSVSMGEVYADNTYENDLDHYLAIADRRMYNNKKSQKR
ncbi:sensor domain-containing diguanylate cyclase [Lactococcus cremoris]|uniref:Diguanylate cyclase (GGDEF) domain protein n=1 Tax=Lactococcus cremoris subsp. tructae TaxID=542833 RepID=A0A2A5SQ68_LACLC|nr:sensor domain-containing diguanylate cyclase [Lactococcus cremoris]PCS16247.1 diguanylate cyclase (GGDEF) domain protein [Lactococcus cremoris subsp. tructae]